jgi:hypothetical protein
MAAVKAMGGVAAIPLAGTAGVPSTRVSSGSIRNALLAVSYYEL